MMLVDSSYHANERTAAMSPRHGHQVHQHCFACGDAPGGLGLRFTVTGDGAVEATFSCAARYQGYDDMLHGGVISTLLDAAMTHCLLAAGVVAVTTELVVKFRRPLRPGIDARISAVIKKNYNRLYLTAAQVTQENRVVAKADGKFFAGSHDNENNGRGDLPRV